MPRTELLLAKLAEECVEVAQRCTKALRFGLTEVQKSQSLNNATRIMDEYIDMLAVIELLQEEDQLPCLDTSMLHNQLRCLEVDMDQRKARIEKYLQLSCAGICQCAIENHNDIPTNNRCFVCGKLIMVHGL